MKDKRRVIKETVHETVDRETGEIEVVSTTKTNVVSKEPDFVKIYLQDIAKLHDLSNSNSSILFEILKYMRYDNTIAIGKYEKREMANKLDISEVTISHCLVTLCKKGILSRKDVGRYIANPFLIAKGSWDEISKIRMIVTYDANGRFIVSDTKNEIDFLYGNKMVEEIFLNEK